MLAVIPFYPMAFGVCNDNHLWPGRSWNDSQPGLAGGIQDSESGATQGPATLGTRSGSSATIAEHGCLNLLPLVSMDTKRERERAVLVLPKLQYILGSTTIPSLSYQLELVKRLLRLPFIVYFTPSNYYKNPTFNYQLRKQMTRIVQLSKPEKLGPLGSFKSGLYFLKID
jgi:hypothetical protein